jgi:hypothetical protein
MPIIFIGPFYPETALNCNFVTFRKQIVIYTYLYIKIPEVITCSIQKQS